MAINVEAIILSAQVPILSLDEFAMAAILLIRVTDIVPTGKAVIGDFITVAMNKFNEDLLD